MAKELPKPVQNFLTLLATDPEVLLEFIKHPERVMSSHNIRNKKTREFIRHCLALEVAKKMLICPDAMHIHW